MEGPYPFFLLDVRLGLLLIDHPLRTVRVRESGFGIKRNTAHTDPLFKNLKILNLEAIYKLQIGKFMYQYRSGLLPYSFNNMFLVTRQVHSYGTRSSELFYLPQCRTNIRKFSISFQGPKFFNSLSFEIRNATSTASFCCKLKVFLLS